MSSSKPLLLAYELPGMLDNAWAISLGEHIQGMSSREGHRRRRESTVLAS